MNWNDPSFCYFSEAFLLNGLAANVTTYSRPCVELQLGYAVRRDMATSRMYQWAPDECRVPESLRCCGPECVGLILFLMYLV